ncbi:MAG: metallophosphoesterase [Planctomycetes bacterium]|nr:metallophosphoesterase [Planctomycetota bacterium]
MEIVVLGDVHGEMARLDRTLELVSDARPELVLFAGDIALDPPWEARHRRAQRERHDDSVRRILARARDAFGAPVVFVPGNHDLADPPADAPATNADRRVVEVAGLSVAGFGGAGPELFGFPYEWKEEEADEGLARLFGRAPPPVNIFLCHTPPRDTTLDRTRGGGHVGSTSVLHWLQVVRPRLFVCGHIHEAWGLERVRGVPCLNAGALGEPYGQEIVWRVEWNGGPVRFESIQGGTRGDPTRRRWTLK